MPTKTPSKAYWKRRQIAAEAAGMKSAAEIESDLAAAYQRAAVDTGQAIYAFYAKYGAKEGITPAEAQKRLSSTEMKDFRTTAAAYLAKASAYSSKRSEEFKKDLRRMSGVAYVSRLTALQTTLTALATDPFMALEDKGSVGLEEAYQKQYLSTRYEMDKAVGIGIDFTKPDTARARAVVSQPWLGKSFSQRVWSDRDTLVAAIPGVLMRGFITGESVDKVAQKLSSMVGSRLSNARRLVQTEMGRVANAADIEVYKDTGFVSAYEYLATLDDRTSEICQDLDGQVFQLSEAAHGVNLPPMHPYCRSTQIPFFKEDEISAATKGLEDRVARGTNGKTYKVGKNTTYKQWIKERGLASDPVAAAHAKTYVSPPPVVAPAGAIPEPAPEPEPEPDPLPPLDLSKLDDIDLHMLLSNDQQVSKSVIDQLKLNDYPPAEVLAKVVDRLSIFRSKATVDANRRIQGVLVDPLELYTDPKVKRLAETLGLSTMSVMDAHPSLLARLVLGDTTAEFRYRILYGSPKGNYQDYVKKLDRGEWYREVEGKYRDMIRKQLKDTSYDFRADNVIEAAIGNKARLLNMYAADSEFGTSVVNLGVTYSHAMAAHVGYTVGRDERSLLWQHVNTAMGESISDWPRNTLSELNQFIQVRGDGMSLEDVIAGTKALDNYDFSDLSGWWAKKQEDEAKALLKRKAAEAAAKAGDLPMTLSNYETTRKEWLDKLQTQPTEQDTITVKENLANAPMILKEMTQGSGLRTCVPGQSTLRKILRSGKFMSQIEVGEEKSKGMKSAGTRKMVSSKLFGHQNESSNIADTDYEYYGYLGKPDPVQEVADHRYRSMRDQYGNVIVTLKRKNLEDRTTFSVGDSLSPGMRDNLIPDKLTDIRGHGFTLYNLRYGKNRLGGGDLQMLWDKFKRENKDPYGDATGAAYAVFDQSYAEAQYHGGVFVSDIESVHIVQAYGDDRPNMMLVKELQALGIPAYWVTVSYADKKTDVRSLW